MNKGEFVKEFGIRTGMSRTEAANAVAIFEEIVTDVVKDGEPVVLTGFCKFARQDVAAKPKRPGRNPATGEEMMFAAKPATVKVRITPLKAFKDGVIAAKRKRARR